MNQLSLITGDDRTGHHGAIFDRSKRYRLQLWRSWDPRLPRIAWCMLNPSTADAAIDDATIRKCMSFSRRWGYGVMRVVNLFSLRSTDPRSLYSSQAPVCPPGYGPDAEIMAAYFWAGGRMVLAWGRHGTMGGRARHVLGTLCPLQVGYLRLTENHQPMHPLYLPRGIEPQWCSAADLLLRSP